MNNKLGVNEYILEEIEYKLINTKLNMLDNTYTFNNQCFNLKYLKDLNEYLFCDIYDVGMREMTIEETYYINDCLNRITEICLSDFNDINEILRLIESIWMLQPFFIGNTRTLIAYLKILKDSFLLDIEIDVNGHIESKPSTFINLTSVNQKRLTK